MNFALFFPILAAGTLIGRCWTFPSHDPIPRARKGQAKYILTPPSPPQKNNFLYMFDWFFLYCIPTEGDLFECFFGPAGLVCHNNVTLG